MRLNVGTLRALVVAMGLALGGTSAALAEDVLVFAASSLAGPLDQVAQTFEAETGHKVSISYAGSNALAKQIVAGAPAQIFISASRPWMAEVEKAGLVGPQAPEVLLSNRLVLVGAAGAAPIALADLPKALGDGKLSMGVVDAVPAGQYGKAALQHLGLWSALEPHVAQSENVRAAMMLVSRGEAPFGIVYASDAKADAQVATLAQFPEDSHPAIVYPIALLSGAEVPKAAQAFYSYLFSAKGQQPFAAAGFQQAPAKP